ncbi:hypothetical protein [Paractinoplanes durhamensis]|uniref:hypothetical protein n=1 Tax=Paractinoplanes durhamensis TaxID=113563 RepID=UPI003624D02C
MIPAAVLRVCGRPPSLEKRRPPVPGAGEVPITVAAAPITPLDLLCASGTSYFGTPATPYVPGVQGSATARTVRRSGSPPRPECARATAA